MNCFSAFLPSPIPEGSPGRDDSVCPLIFLVEFWRRRRHSEIPVLVASSAVYHAHLLIREHDLHCCDQGLWEECHQDQGTYAWAKAYASLSEQLEAKAFDLPESDLQQSTAADGS